MAETGEVTRLLAALRAGEGDAVDRLLPLVYDELKRIAHGHLRRHRHGGTLDTTGLVHEAYLKLAGGGIDVRDRGHFLAVSARAMRQVLVDLARARAAAKRGGPAARPVTLEEDSASVDAEAERLLDLDRALDRLRAVNERLAAVVECRYFAGYSEEETAEALGVALRTAQRDWLRARAWLREALSEESGGPA